MSTDVLKLTYKDFPEKLSETLLLTVAALTNRFMKLPGNSQHKVRPCITPTSLDTDTLV